MPLMGVRPSLLEQVSDKLEDILRGDGLLGSERNSKTITEKGNDNLEDT